MNRCKCGCGEEARNGNSFSHGHNRRGQHHTAETKRRMGSSIALALSGRSYEDLHSEEKAQLLRNIRSRRMKEQWTNNANYRRYMTSLRGRNNHFYGRFHSEESRQRMSKSHAGVPLSDKHTRAIIIANNIRPNKVEKQLLVILGAPWQFVGDGQLIIGGKCPDFWDGNKGLKELFGDYWHKGENPRNRIKLFAEYGYECEIIWEHQVIAQIAALREKGILVVEKQELKERLAEI